jgi:hypothetical protein
LAAPSSSSSIADLKLRYAGSLVEQLGAQLYPRVTATVAELISNAWDADARNVWVTIPFDTWKKDSEIIVVDDGIGMSHDQAREAYLIVGRKRRVEEGTDRSPTLKRHLHGRKGIGKLAAFGTARILECVTLSQGVLTAFSLDYDKIRKLKPSDDYQVEPVADQSPPSNPPTGKPLTRGTRVTLRDLWMKRSISEPGFMRSMSRRFAIAQGEMNVFINGTLLQRFNMNVQFRFPRDAQPSEIVRVDPDGWAVELLPDGKEVRWWIGFTEKPLDDEQMQGISVLAGTKMAQRPFMFERVQGTTGQLGQEYLVGEVQAEWLDEGQDITEDFIQSNRDQLQIEDERLDPFVEWGRGRLAWALRERNRLRQEKTLEDFKVSPEYEDLLKGYTPKEQQGLMKIAEQASKFPEMEPADVRDLMGQVLNAREDRVVRALMEEIAEQDDPFQERMWKLVHDFGLLDARRNLTIIEARLKTIEKLKEAVARGAKEVPDIHDIIRSDAWLLDPRWHPYDDEVDLASLGLNYKPEKDEKGQIVDFLFVLRPSKPAPIDEVIVVEIKRGRNSDGTVRRATEDEVNKFHGYVGQLKAYYSKNTRVPIVRGLMIAEDYSERANIIRHNLEQILDPRMEFKTWERVIDETERMHRGWLTVSRRRAERPDGGKLGQWA